MSKTGVYARNLLANWIGYGANLAVAFFLSPLMVHSLGDAAYGVWTLLVSLTGYLGLVDVGVRGGTGRYINYFLGRGQRGKVSDVVTTSLVFYLAISLLVLLSAAALGWYFPHIFTKVPESLAQQALPVLLLLGVNVWLSFFASTFVQMLEARDRFDLEMICDVMVLALRTGGTIWALQTGKGLTALAGIQVLSGMVGCMLLALFARWKGPEVRLRRSHISWPVFKEVFGFGVWSFLGSSSAMFGVYASSAIIGLLIGAKEITHYSIAAMLVGYGRTLVGHLANIMTPEIFKASAREDLAELRRLTLKTTRATMFLAVPLLVGFMMLGKEFIHVWMGPDYVTSAWILLILCIPQFLLLANRPLLTMLNGLGHVRLLAAMAAVESGSILVLTVLLVTLGEGIYGVAWGSIMPTMAVHVWLFLFACLRLDAKPAMVLQRTAFRWISGSLLFAALCFVVIWLVPAGGWYWFWLKIPLLLLLYLPIGLLVVMRGKESLLLLRRLTAWPAGAAQSAAKAGGQT